MDEDEFNDFQSAPAQQHPNNHAIDELTLSVHSQPANAAAHSSSLLEDLSLQPSFSQITNPPSEGIREIDSIDWQGSLQTPMVKMESQMVAASAPNNLHFGKTLSETDFETKPKESQFDYLSLGNFNPAQQIPAVTVHNTSSHPSQNPPDQSTHPHSLDYDFGLGSFSNRPEKEGIVNAQAQPKPTTDNPFPDTAQAKLQGQPLSQESKQLVEENRKQSEEFVFQSEVTREDAQVATVEDKGGEKPRDLMQEELLLSYETVEQTFPIPSQQVDVRKQSEDFVFSELVEPFSKKQQPLFEQENIQPRKQSDDFEFQSATQAQHKQPQQPEAEVHQPAPQSVIHTDFLSQKYNINKTTLPENSDGSEPIPSSQQQAIIQGQAIAQINQPAEEEDEEFGEFQETIQHSEQQNNINQAEIKEHSYQQEVKIIAEKAPYNMNIPSREKQLQAFVDSLPDYSFLFVQAFNSL